MIPYRNDNYTTTEAQNKYLASLKAHIEAVQQAAKIVGLRDIDVADHDASKFTIHEFPYYAGKFFGGIDDPEGWKRAWLHHIHNNPHHPEYWLLPEKDGTTKPLEMPEVYMREMVADWMGASYTYTGSWDMSDWLNQNFVSGKIKLHPETREYARIALYEIGYRRVDNTPQLALLDTSKYQDLE